MSRLHTEKNSANLISDKCVNLCTPRYPIGCLVREQEKYNIDCRYGIVVDSEASNGKEEFIDVQWFSDPMAASMGVTLPYFATTSTKRVQIVSNV